MQHGVVLRFRSGSRSPAAPRPAHAVPRWTFTELGRASPGATPAEHGGVSRPTLSSLPAGPDRLRGRSRTNSSPTRRRPRAVQRLRPRRHRPVAPPRSATPRRSASLVRAPAPFDFAHTVLTDGVQTAPVDPRAVRHRRRPGEHRSRDPWDSLDGKLHHRDPGRVSAFVSLGVGGKLALNLDSPARHRRAAVPLHRRGRQTTARSRPAAINVLSTPDRRAGAGGHDGLRTRPWPGSPPLAAVARRIDPGWALTPGAGRRAGPQGPSRAPGRSDAASARRFGREGGQQGRSAAGKGAGPSKQPSRCWWAVGPSRRAPPRPGRPSPEREAEETGRRPCPSGRGNQLLRVHHDRRERRRQDQPDRHAQHAGPQQVRVRQRERETASTPRIETQITSLRPKAVADRGRPMMVPGRDGSRGTGNRCS